MPKPDSSRNVAQQYIAGLIEEGYTNTEIVRKLKDEGLGYRNQMMFADVNQTRLELFGASQIKNLSEDTSIPLKYMTSRNLPREYPYAAVVKYNFYAPGSNDLQEGGTMLFFSSRPSQSDVLEAYGERLETLLAIYPDKMEVIGGAEKVHYFKQKRKR